MKLIWHVLLRRHKALLFLVIFFNILQLGLILAQPLLLSALNNKSDISQPTTSQDTYILGGILIALAVVWIIIILIKNYLLTRLEVAVMEQLQKKVFEKSMFLSLEDKQLFSKSKLINICVKDVKEISKTSTFIFRPMFLGILYFIGAIVLLFVLNGKNWQIPVAIVTIAVSIGIIYGCFAIWARKFWVRTKKASDKLAVSIHEKINGVRPIRSFLLQSVFDYDIEKRWKEVVHKSEYAALVIQGALAFATVVIYLISPFILLLGITVTNLKAADILSIMQSSNLLILGITLIALSTEQLLRTNVSFIRTREIIFYKNKIEYTGTKSILTNDIVFDNVSFMYDKEGGNVLKNVSFKINSDETVGIIGTTGSGKTTLINLLMHRLVPTEGNILVDNIPIKEIDIKCLRSSFSINEQTPLLFKGTFIHNILFGQKNIEKEIIDESIDIAQARDFIFSTEKGLESLVAPKAKNLSGGQKQRLAIARALCRKGARTLILDDSTSALDMITERKLINALKKQNRFKSIIIIAQRITNIVNCDKIIVMDSGRIVGMGKWNELLKDCQVFKEIYQSQIKED
ncbi:ABC transporter ATP-binding protein [Ureaplasma canigenitalium]|uniref:ABC transporter ATP-binding protein n=1 Tax=Ureaplasma canigenitalium TaxID=42092 RepID=UPI0004E26156|nr:ABC transporter ATP-binding protein [Ureaplasma canigenitalium]